MAFIIGGTAGAIAGAGILSAGTSLAAGAMGASAAKDAAEGQAKAGMYATDMQKKMYDQTREDQQPWRMAGVSALGQMQDTSFNQHLDADNFKTMDPGFDFRMKEGQKALERSAAARGGLQSGGTLKALTQYSQDYASNEFGNAYNRFEGNQTNRFNRLASVAGLGQTANNATSQAGQTAGTNMGNIAVGTANAQGAAGIAGANAWGNAMSGVANTGQNWMMMNMMNKKWGLDG